MQSRFPFTGCSHSAFECQNSREWIEFELNPDAKFSDGSPVTVEDVIFSLEIIEEKGRPPFRNWYAQIKEKSVTAPNRLKLVFENGDNRELPLLVALAPIFSKKHTDAETFDRSTLTPLVASGPLHIQDHRTRPAGGLREKSGLLGERPTGQKGFRQFR